MTAACSHRRAVLTRNSSVVLSGSASSKVRIRRHSSAPGKIRGRRTRTLDDGCVRCAIRRLRAIHSRAGNRSRAALPDPPPHAAGALHAGSPPMQSPPAKGMPQPRRQPQQRESLWRIRYSFRQGRSLPITLRDLSIGASLAAVNAQIAVRNAVRLTGCRTSGHMSGFARLVRP
jgi:hypothetical protein